MFSTGISNIACVSNLCRNQTYFTAEFSPVVFVIKRKTQKSVTSLLPLGDFIRLGFVEWIRTASQKLNSGEKYERGRRMEENLGSVFARLFIVK